jgi:hypothetical protein
VNLGKPGSSKERCLRENVISPFIPFIHLFVFLPIQRDEREKRNIAHHSIIPRRTDLKKYIFFTQWKKMGRLKMVL